MKVGQFVYRTVKSLLSQPWRVYLSGHATFSYYRPSIQARAPTPSSCPAPCEHKGERPSLALHWSALHDAGELWKPASRACTP